VEESLWLLFARDKKSELLAHSFIVVPNPARVGFLYPWYYSGSGIDLGDYTILRPRLAHLQERMKSWRPSSFSELFIPSYYDRFTWFTAIFGVGLGIIGALNLVTSIIQIIIAWKAWKEPVSPSQ